MESEYVIVFGFENQYCKLSYFLSGDRSLNIKKVGCLFFLLQLRINCNNEV